MRQLEDVLARVENLSLDVITDAIRSIGFECTRCGDCCIGLDGDDHAATIFPGEIRTIRAVTGREFDEVARPMPFGLQDGAGETFEWALQTDGDGNCVFHTTEEDGSSACRIYGSRPLICRTYPFSVDLGFSDDRAVSIDRREGPVVAYECPGLGRPIDREHAGRLAATLQTRARREVEEAIAVRDGYEIGGRFDEQIVVYDSDGPKRPDGTRLS